MLLIRDEAHLLPLHPEQKVLLVEQVFWTHQMANNMSCHPGMLWEAMCELSPNIGSVEIPLTPRAHDPERILRRIEEAEVIVTINYYYPSAAKLQAEEVRIFYDLSAMIGSNGLME